MRGATVLGKDKGESFMKKNRIRPIETGKGFRMSFQRQKEVLEMPNLIEVQKNSYRWFLEQGLREVFDDISPIEDYGGKLSLEFADYKFYDSDTEDTNLYMQAPDSSIQKDGKTTGSEEVTQSGDAEESNVSVVWKGDVSSDATAITLYNFTFQSGQTLRFFGTGTITVAYGANNSQRLISSGAMSDGYVDVTINSDQASALSDGIMIYGNNFTLTKIVVL